MFYKRYLLKLCALLVLIPFMASCDNGPVFEKEKECSVKVMFSFKKHRQALHSAPENALDVFESTVGSVHLFVYDAQTDELVFEKTEKTANLKTAAELSLGAGSERCFMPVALSPGKYRFIAWCGLDESDSNNAFMLDTETTRAGYFHCHVKRSEKTGHPVNDAKYESIYHGAAHSVEISRIDDKTVIPVELTKNNNDIAVWVQHTSAAFAEGDYEVVYTDSNGSMKFEDNTMGEPERLEYHPHSTSLLSASTEYNGSMVEAGALVAHLSTSRLMEAHKNDARLEVRNREGKTLFSIPFIKYLLEMQTFTSDGQYYLDCEDTYNCSFYISGEREDNGTWVPGMIIINNWVMVPGQNENV